MLPHLVSLTCVLIFSPTAAHGDGSHNEGARRWRAVMLRILCSLGILTLVVLQPAPDQAMATTLSIFSSQSAFFSAAPIASTETFEEFLPFTFFTTPQVTIDNVVYFTDPCLLADLGGCWTMISPGVDSSNRFGPNNIGTVELSLGENNFVSALGFYFIGGGSTSGIYELFVDEIDGTRTLINIGPLPPSILYFGFLSSSGIRDVTFDSIGNERNNLEFDDVSRGPIESLSAVPEPTSFALFATGIVALIANRWRKGKCLRIRS
jgi:PEP-CTERM motif